MLTYLLVQKLGSTSVDMYVLHLGREEAVLAEPGTFFQLVNNSPTACEVLYIVSPAYVFEVVGEDVIYDDSITLEEGWDELKKNEWAPSKPLPTKKDRAAALERLRNKSEQ